MNENTTELTDTAQDNAASQNEPSQPPKKKRHVIRNIVVILGVLLVVAILLAIGAVMFGIAPQSCEVGEALYHPAGALPFCEIKTDLNSIDSSKLGEHTVRLCFFGFLTLDSSITVCDSVPPAVSARNLVLPTGFDVTIDDIIEGVEDKTALTIEFIDPDSPEKGICAADEGGNVTNAVYTLTYTDALIFDDFELGCTKADISNMLMSVEGLSAPSLSEIDFDNCGTYRISGTFDGIDCIFTVTIKDTLAPVAKVSSYDILIGQTPTAADFVTNISDKSEVRVYFLTEPIYNKAGKQDVTVVLEDAAGNINKYKAKLNIHNLTSPITIEAGTTTDEFKSLIRKKLATGEALPRVSDNFETEHLTVGTHKTELVGEFSVIPLEIIVEDTTAPMLILKQVTVYTGNMPSVTDFVAGCVDESSVKLSFASEPDVSRVGNLLVTIVASDIAGNKTEASTMLRITKDDVPPVIYGVKNISVYEGESISYRRGITAVDEKDGSVTVKVDSSRVNTKAAGTYYVTYTATDSDGNITSVTAAVTIKPINAQAVNSFADEVLSSIINNNMTARQKARAIYDWCTGTLKYSTTTSHLMGYFSKAAYSGFSKHYGNCYTYYAVASALLTRAGIYNIEIQRNDPDNPHYWNLVQIDGKWYHFDTCPQPSPHKLEVFLLTDKQVRAFELDYYYNFNADNYPDTT